MSQSSSSNPDLLLTAGFDDKTEKFFKGLEDNFAKMSQMSGEANQQVSSGAGQSAVKLGLLAGAVGGVTAKLTEMALQAAAAFPAFIKQSIQIAAQAQTAGIALGVVAENAGYTADEVNNLKDEMIEMGIAEDTAVDTLLKLAGAEQDLTKATDLARVAFDAATVSGKSEEETLRRITHAIITKNTEMTRDLQLGVDRQKMTKEYTKETGVAATAISNRANVGMFLNGVIEAGIKLDGARFKGLETAAGKAKTMDEAIHNLQKSLGDVFLPSHTLWLQQMAMGIENMSMWVDANSDTLQEWAEILGGFVAILIDVGKATLEFAGAVLTLLNAGNDISSIFTNAGETLVTLIYGEEEAAKRMENLGTTAKQAGVLIVMAISASIATITGFIDIIGQAINWVGKFAMFKTGKIDVEALDEATKELSDTWKYLGEDVMAKMTTSAENAMQAFGMMGDEGEEAAEKTEEAVDELGNALKEAEQKVKDLNKTFADEMAEIAKRRGRAVIDRAVREARQREDIERRHQDRIEDIIANAKDRRQQVLQDADEEIAALAEEQADQRANLERGKGDRLIDIEVDYRRRLADIQRDYLYSVDEAARKNDAVAILRLMRENTKKLQEEDTNRKRNKKDAQIDYEGQLADLKRSQKDRRKEIQGDREQRLQELEVELEDSLQKAEESRLKDYENLNRSLARQREDRLRHQAWEEEDRAAAHEKELRALGQHFAGVEGATRAHFEALLAEHGLAITGLDVMWDEYMKRQSGRGWNLPGVSSPDKWEKQRESEIVERTGGGATSKEWEFATGGAAVVSKPTNVLIGEGGPEAMFAMPLSGMQQHRLGGDLNVNVHGVSPQMEQQIAPVIYQIIEALFEKM